MFRAPDDRLLPEGYFRNAKGLIVPGSVRMIAPGISVAGHMGRKTAAAPAAIAYQDSNVTVSATATPPSGTAGWVIVGFAWRTASNTIPTVPAGFTAPPLSRSTNNCGAVFGWKYHSGSEGSYTWTNAAGVMYGLYSGCHASSPIGDLDANDTNTTTWPVPGKTLLGAGTTSWVIVFGLANSEDLGTPSGLTRRQRNPAAGGLQRAYYDTNAAVASFSSRTGTLTGSGDRALGMSIELLVA